MSSALLEPRLYRAAFAPAVLALIVLAFSLQDQASSIATELVPPSFNAQRAVTFADQLVKNEGSRESGSTQDQNTAELVRARLSEFGFGAAAYEFDSTTIRGSKKLENVVGVRPGPSDRRLVILASRDGAPGKLERAGAYETGVLLELARVLQGRAFDHTLVLASVTGGVDGGLGAAEFAESARRPIDGVLVLRNIAAARKGPPVLDVYDTRRQPDPVFVRTIQRIAAVDLPGGAGNRPLTAQLVRLAFPLALGEQGTFPNQDLTAAAVSPGGEPLAQTVDKPTASVDAIGQLSLRTLTTFDGSFKPDDPSAKPLAVGGKVIPQRALVLFFGALLLPLLVAAIDAWARARRRARTSIRGLVAVPLAFAWLLLLGLLLRAIAFSGAIDAPPLPPNPLALSGAAPIVVGFVFLALAVLGVAIAAALVRQRTPAGGESGFALWLVAAGIVVFAVNPIACAFVLVMLHLLVLLLLTGGAARKKILMFVLVGSAPLVAAALYYPFVLDLAPLASIRYAVLLEAGGFIGPLALIAGCLAVAAIAVSILHLLWTSPRMKRSNTATPLTPLRTP